MLTKNKKGNFQTEIINLDYIVPQDHILRIIENEFDFSFIYEYVEDLYSLFGRPSIDPVVLFKCHFLKVYYGISSLRRTYDEIRSKSSPSFFHCIYFINSRNIWFYSQYPI